MTAFAPIGTVPPVLRITELSKVRTHGQARFELALADFQVGQGAFIAVVGDSGCGKSTLLDILAMVLKPTTCLQFTIQANGIAVDVAKLWNDDSERELAATRRANLGYVLQTGGLLPFLTVEENIRLPARICGIPLDTRRIKELAERIKIGGLLDRKPQHLSGGQRQRAAILRAIAHSPPIILADEPTAAVDKLTAQGIVDDMFRMTKDQHTSVVMVTHDRELVRGKAEVVYGFDIQRHSDEHIQSVCRRLEGL